ncbi:MAG: hypothetical protein HY646_01845 [Acidobacteria bacterium]|nr:hypothetical protein [Acidobacteriota bacterium]
MAKYALLEKANLQLAHARKAEAAQTLRRMKAISTSDALLARKTQDLERRIS